MSILGIGPSQNSIEIMSEINRQSNDFYKTSIKGKKLHCLKIFSETYKRDFYQSLKEFFKKRKIRLGPPQIDELVDSLQLISDLKKIYSEMEVQERRLVIQALRKVCANPKISALALVVTICLTAYTAIAFAIAPELHGGFKTKGLIFSGIAAVVLGTLLVLLFHYLEHLYAKVKIGKYDLPERALFSGYFRCFGKLEFDKCKDLIENMEVNLRNEIEYKWRKNLLNLAQACQTYKISVDEGENQEKSEESDDQESDSVLETPWGHSKPLPYLRKLNFQMSCETLGVYQSSEMSSQNPGDISKKYILPSLSLSSQGSLLFEPFDYTSDDESEKNNQAEAAELTGHEIESVN